VSVAWSSIASRTGLRKDSRNSASMRVCVALPPAPSARVIRSSLILALRRRWRSIRARTCSSTHRVCPPRAYWASSGSSCDSASLAGFGVGDTEAPDPEVTRAGYLPVALARRGGALESKSNPPPLEVRVQFHVLVVRLEGLEVAGSGDDSRVLVLLLAAAFS